MAKNIYIKRLDESISYVRSEIESGSEDPLNDFEEIITEQYNKIKELEATIENMKAIAGEKIEPINSVTSIDYVEEKTTELITVKEDIFSDAF